MRLFLIGFMGSGKTHWGHLLSEHLHIPFFDLDAVIEDAEGRSIAAIFDEQGEEHFRMLERDHLATLIEQHADMILSCGGGTPCYFKNIDAMKNAGTVVWLNTAVDAIVERLRKEKAKRPLVRDISDEGLRSYIQKKMNDRRIFYEQAQVIVQEDQVDFDALLKAIQHA